MNKKLLAKQAAIYNEIFSNMNGGPIGSIAEIIKKEKVKKELDEYFKKRSEES